MYTIEYDIYYRDDDFRNKSKCRSVFPGLKNIGDFLKGNAVDPPGSSGLKVYYENIGIAYPICSFDYDSQKTISIHTIIEDGRNIIYSSGKYTKGVRHLSEKVMNFLYSLQIEYDDPETYIKQTADKTKDEDHIESLLSKLRDLKQEKQIDPYRMLELKDFLGETEKFLKECRDFRGRERPAKGSPASRR